jgi:hypothetical protein
MSGLVHAVVETHAPLKARLRHEIIGQGDERRCKVWGTFKGEITAHEYTSVTLKEFRDNRPVKDGKVGGSPLWDSNPEVQMFYATTRQWARLYCPDVLLGVYTEDELSTEDRMVDVTPQLSPLVERLKAAKLAPARRGFDQDQVAKTLEGEVVDTPDSVAAKATQAKSVMEQAAKATNKRK